MVSQNHKSSINYFLQIVGLVICAFCLASSLAFLLSRYVLDVPNDNDDHLIALPPRVSPENDVLPIPTPDEPNVLSSSPVVTPVPQSPTIPPTKPEKLNGLIHTNLPTMLVAQPDKPKTRNASIHTKPFKTPSLPTKVQKHVKPSPPRATKRSAQFKAQVAKQHVNPTAKPLNGATPAPVPKAQSPRRPDFKTLEQSLGITL